jgi:hypothetical protein
MELSHQPERKQQEQGEQQGEQSTVEPVTVSEERETTGNIPIVRGNTPRLLAYTSISTAQNTQPMPLIRQEDAYEQSYTGVYASAPALFPTKPPSAPPVPEAEARFDEIEKSRLPPSLPLIKEEPRVQDSAKTQEEKHISFSSPTISAGVPETPVPRYYALVGFACYLLCLLLLTFVFAVVQGLGMLNGVLGTDILFLGVPWLVLVYGLLSGCISCLITLGRLRPHALPGFVVLTWYTRPFVAMVLALFAYHVLNSGLLSASGDTSQRQTIALLVGVGAGVCESWLFLRRKD